MADLYPKCGNILSACVITNLFSTAHTCMWYCTAVSGARNHSRYCTVVSAISTICTAVI